MALKLKGAISDAKARQKADATRRAVADGILDPTTLYNEDVSGKLTTTLFLSCLFGSSLQLSRTLPAVTFLSCLFGSSRF